MYHLPPRLSPQAYCVAAKKNNTERVTGITRMVGRCSEVYTNLCITVWPIIILNKDKPLIFHCLVNPAPLMLKVTSLHLVLASTITENNVDCL